MAIWVRKQTTFKNTIATLGFVSYVGVVTIALLIAACGPRDVEVGEAEKNADGERVERSGGLFSAGQTNIKNGAFYRVKASFRVKETGEIVDFNYVAACNINITKWRYSSPSDDSTFEPRGMVMPTSTGGAILVRTPRVCAAWTKIPGQVFDKFMPMAIWFDDVKDMQFGWGYTGEAAYEGPFAKMAFIDASIESASAEDWKKWRADSAAVFEQIGLLPGPWGFHPQDENDKGIAYNCYGYSYFRIPEAARAALAERWPETGEIKYWTPKDSEELNKVSQLLTSFSGWGVTGGYLSDFGTGMSNESGVPTRDGGGAISSKSKSFPSDGAFPLLNWRQSMRPFPTTPQDAYQRKIDFRGGAMNGLVACGRDNSPDLHAAQRLLEPIDPNFRTKKNQVLIDDVLVQEDATWAGGRPILIIANQSEVFFYGATGQ